MMLSLVQIAAVLLLVGIMLLALYWHWRVFSLYRSLNLASDKIRLLRVRISVSERASRQAIWRSDVRDGLSPHLLAQVATVRQQARYIEYTMVCCAITLLALIIASLRV